MKPWTILLFDESPEVKSVVVENILAPMDNEKAVPYIEEQIGCTKKLLAMLPGEFAQNTIII
tara:strand:- start:8941 stop:9126 length:186 start_codon:yes stop_codon:yes gene_type:complete